MRFHRHKGPIVATQPVQVYSDISGCDRPIDAYTHLLRRCEKCGEPFVTKVKGDWGEAAIKNLRAASTQPQDESSSSPLPSETAA